MLPLRLLPLFRGLRSRARSSAPLINCVLQVTFEARAGAGAGAGTLSLTLALEDRRREVRELKRAAQTDGKLD